MTHLLRRALFLFILLAQFPQAHAEDVARNSDHEKLRELKARVTEAFNKRDARAITSCFTRNFAITTIDQTTFTSADQIDRYFQRVFRSPDAFVTDLKVSPEAEVLTVFTDADNGYCYGKNHETYTMKGGRIVPMESRWTAYLRKEDGAWKIAALHAGVNFLDNPVLARCKARERIMAAAGFGAGVVVTLAGGALFSRRRIVKG